MRLRAPLAGTLAVATLACGPRGSAAGDPSADSARVAPSAGSHGVAGDSGAPARDSTPKDGSVAPGSRPTSPTTVGRDSAFGPRFLVDSTGKLIPVPTKKP